MNETNSSKAATSVAAKRPPIKRIEHGLSGTKEYHVWEQIKGRTTNPRHKFWPYYGGRGITCCTRWIESFPAFLTDMGHCPPGMSIDRIENSGNYEPGNCRWATVKEQHRNLRSNRWIEHRGRRMIFGDWARHLGIKRQTLLARLERGWSMTRALDTTKCR